MDALPGDGDEEVLRNLKEGRRKESVNVDGDEWMYELEDDPAKQAQVLETYEHNHNKGRIEVESVKTSADGAPSGGPENQKRSESRIVREKADNEPPQAKSAWACDSKGDGQSACCCIS
jgi:hypothetical protein|uniref:Uncharacterized protein n=1 Tax=Eutreptiella gymnastica TaxID=73025 RepID=A0A7S4CQE5_9EUGL|mmetsp:Transcript_45186/g.76101  ORF Transcript_45186/g.76101 Transcript_45186/m.76101 type:complete len:119 (-) Transcript_45186:184-540(-)